MTEFRPLADGEEPAVIALWSACDLTRPWNPPEADIALARSSPNSDILTAWEGDTLRATVLVGHDGHRAWAYYVAVDPAARRGGWGAQAMAAAEAWAKAQGLPKIQLMVRRSNAEVLAFYASLGYADSGVTVMERWLDEDRAALKRRPE